MIIISVSKMEKERIGLSQKLLILSCLVVICVLVYFSVIVPSFGHEGDTVFHFYEVSYNETINSTVIHLNDNDFINIRGLYVRWKSGKLYSISFRNSDNPAILPYAFNDNFGSQPGNDSSRKYLEYNGSYYYGEMTVH